MTQPVPPSGLGSSLERRRQLPATGARPSTNGHEPTWCGVPTPAVVAGVRVPAQAETWSCGVNGAARALAALGAPVADVDAFVRAAPRLNIFGIAIGPPPVALAAYVRRAGGLGAQASVGKFDDAAGLERRLRAGWRRGEPSLVLTCADAVRLHWVLALGVAADGQVAVLDSDGCLESRAGGVEELAQAADMSQSLGFQVGILQPHSIGRFNAVSFAGRRGAPHVA